MAGLVIATSIIGVLNSNAIGVLYLIAAVAWVLVLYQHAMAVPVNLPWL